MNHLSEEELVLHYYGEECLPAMVDQHLADCAECRTSYNALRLVLNTLDAAPIPERGPTYGSEVWQRIESRVRGRRWRTYRWWILSPVAAGLLVLAFMAGRMTQAPTVSIASAAQVRERILLVAVGDHLDRSQMVLAEIGNAEPRKGLVDISGERRFAGELLDDNRLYRQTATGTGDRAMASVLDDLERVLLEIANSPSSVTPGELEQLRSEIRDRGLLFKVRIIGSQARRNAALGEPKRSL